MEYKNFLQINLQEVFSTIAQAAILRAASPWDGGARKGSPNLGRDIVNNSNDCLISRKFYISSYRNWLPPYPKQRHRKWNQRQRACYNRNDRVIRRGKNKATSQTARCRSQTDEQIVCALRS